eukprot:8464120-Alexandrium_andersonii.AAC.1
MRQMTLGAACPDRKRARQARAVAMRSAASNDSRRSLPGPRTSAPKAGGRQTQRCVERLSTLLVRTARERAKSGRSPHAALRRISLDAP